MSSILEHIEKNPGITTDKVIEDLDCSNVCGTCRADLEEIVEGCQDEHI